MKIYYNNFLLHCPLVSAKLGRLCWLAVLFCFGNDGRPRFHILIYHCSRICGQRKTRNRTIPSKELAPTRVVEAKNSYLYTIIVSSSMSSSGPSIFPLSNDQKEGTPWSTRRASSRSPPAITKTSQPEPSQTRSSPLTVNTVCS